MTDWEKTIIDGTVSVAANMEHGDRFLLDYLYISLCESGGAPCTRSMEGIKYMLSQYHKKTHSNP